MAFRYDWLFNGLIAQRADLLEEQLGEMKADRDSQVRRLEALRKKNQDERDKSTQEIEEIKAECERQLDDFRRKVVWCRRFL